MQQTLQAFYSGKGQRVRKTLGIGVLVIGVAALGFWARAHQAPRIEKLLTEDAASVVAGSVHGVATAVSGRDVRVSGIADSAKERDSLLAALNGIEGRRVVTDEMTVLDAASPFEITVTKSDTGLVAKGNVPTEAARSELNEMIGGSAAGLTLAAGAPDGWTGMAMQGIAALEPLISGVMVVSDSSLRIVGEARTPVELDKMKAALAGLPETAVQTEITLQDDGSPANYVFDYQAATGAVLTGKSPVGGIAEAIAAALGLGKVEDQSKQALMGTPGDAGVFAKLKPWMADFEALSVSMQDGAVSVVARLAAGLDAAKIRSEMAAALGPDVALDVAVATPTGADGDERVNALTGIKERFSGTYWLAVPEFELTSANCQAETDKVLAGRSVNFLSGSEKLDTDNLAVLNDMASVIRECTTAGGLRAEIGGHTDSTGDENANRRLSQMRAAAVRQALADRGVPRAMMVSKGYGASEPIADNETEEGKALNRRTTVKWSK